MSPPAESSCNWPRNRASESTRQREPFMSHEPSTPTSPSETARFAAGKPRRRTPPLPFGRLLKKGLSRPRNKDLRHEFDRRIRTYVDGPDFLSSLQPSPRGEREPEIPAAKSVFANSTVLPFEGPALRFRSRWLRCGRSWINGFLRICEEIINVRWRPLLCRL